MKTVKAKPSSGTKKGSGARSTTLKPKGKTKLAKGGSSAKQKNIAKPIGKTPSRHSPKPREVMSSEYMLHLIRDAGLHERSPRVAMKKVVRMMKAPDYNRELVFATFKYVGFQEDRIDGLIDSIDAAMHKKDETED